MRRYFIFVTKKCRIYAACGVSQTPNTPSCRKESGEYLIPLKEGIITESLIIGSVGELLLGKVPGRQSKNDITVFDALGLAVEDISSTELVYLESKK